MKSLNGPKVIQHSTEEVKKVKSETGQLSNCTTYLYREEIYRWHSKNNHIVGCLARSVSRACDFFFLKILTTPEKPPIEVGGPVQRLGSRKKVKKQSKSEGDSRSLKETHFLKRGGEVNSTPNVVLKLITPEIKSRILY